LILSHLQRVLYACLLAILLASLYFMTYSARQDSGDELRIFDGASSWARYGDWGRDETLWLGTPDGLLPQDPYPIETLQDDEQAMASLVSWLYRLGDVVPMWGLVHVAWLTNMLITIVCVLVFYGIALTLGYDLRIALVGAVLLGVCTLVWAYSKTLFREPAVMLFLLMSAWGALISQKSVGAWRMVGIVWAVVGFFCAVQIKTSAIFAIPCLLVFAIPLPQRLINSFLRRLSDGLLIFVVIGVMAFAYVAPFSSVVVQILNPILTRISSTQEFAQTAVHTYLFSVGGSFWGTSPILLLAVLGAIMLVRRDKRRLVWGIVLMIIAYAFGHAFLTGQHWFGGLSFPPRFLLPIVPFVMLGVLPVLDIAYKHRAWALIALTVVLVGYSMWIQFVAVASYWRSYADLLLPPESQGLGEWSDGLNRLQDIRWVLYPQAWGTIGLDFAWRRANLPNWAFANGVLVVVSVALILLATTRPKTIRGVMLATPVVILLWLGVNTMGLRALNQLDSEYQAQNASLHQALEFLATESQPNEILLLPDRTFEDFVLNYQRVTNTRPFVLPYQPGERVSGEVSAQVVSDSTGDLLTWFSMRAIDHFHYHHQRLWLLTSTSQYLPWAVRPVERYLAENYYLIREMPLNNPEVRLLQFDLTPYPLDGFTLPKGTTYRRGESVPIALFWQTDAPISDDLIVSWFIVPKDGTTLIVQGMDTAPHAGFAPTNTWQVGVPVQDRRALILPSDLPSGEYQIWVLVYRFVDGAPQRLNVTGASTLDETIGVLPIRLKIN
jgi:hypothetical protein